MELLQFVAQASLPNIDKYLSYIDRGQVEIREQSASAEGVSVSVKVGSSGAKTVKFTTAEGLLLRISCSCRKNMMRKPCAHALAAVSEWVNRQGGLPLGDDTPEEDLANLKVAREQAEAAKPSDEKWTSLHVDWVLAIGAVMAQAHFSMEEKDWGSALSFIEIVFRELSFVPIRFKEGLPTVEETCIEAENLYIDIYQQAPEDLKAQHYSVLPNAYEDAVLREEARGGHWALIHPANYLVVLAAGYFSTEALDWFEKEVRKQMQILKPLHAELYGVLAESLVAVFVHCDKLEEGREVFQLLDNQDFLRKDIEADYSRMSVADRKKWTLFFEGM
ncbi:MAG: SWIM zinc finger family protein [Saprospiraceae bacterium]